MRMSYPYILLQNPQQFILDLLKFVQAQTQMDMSADRVQHITLALTALANVIIKNPGMSL